MLHAQPSANHEQPLPHPGVLGHRRAVDVSRQAQLAFPYYTTYLPQGTTAHTYFIHTRSRSESHSQTQPREQNPKSTHTPDNSSSCALPGPGNIINNTNKHTQPDPLACSLARTHASTHPPTHATRLPKLPSEKRRSVLFLSIVQVPFPACSLTQPGWPALHLVPVPNTVPYHTRSHVTRLWSTAATKPPQTSIFSPDLLLLLALQRTSITRLAPRPCLFDPSSRPLSKKGALIPLPTRGRAFLACCLRPLPSPWYPPPPSCVTSHPATSRPPSFLTHPSNNIQPSP